jgi:hypothetical protein
MSIEALYAESHSYPSFSQAGEDRILYYLFDCLGSGFCLRYADLGAAAPAGHNNTYLFYTLGGRGLLVEADPEYLPAYSEVRPRDTVERVAIVPASMRHLDNVPFYAMKNRGWSTISPEYLKIAGELGKGEVRATFEVPCRTINEVLASYAGSEPLDLLSIDLEGIDAIVLDEFDIDRFRPKAIVIENNASKLQADEKHATRLLGCDYALFASTWVNSIYVDSACLRDLHI